MHLQTAHFERTKYAQRAAVLLSFPCELRLRRGRVWEVAEDVATGSGELLQLLRLLAEAEVRAGFRTHCLLPVIHRMVYTTISFHCSFLVGLLQIGTDPKAGDAAHWSSLCLMDHPSKDIRQAAVRFFADPSHPGSECLRFEAHRARECEPARMRRGEDKLPSHGPRRWTLVTSCYKQT